MRQPQALSYHLSKLKKADLIYETKFKNFIYYELKKFIPACNCRGRFHIIMKITGSQRHSFVFVETDKRQIIWVDKQGNISVPPYHPHGVVRVCPGIFHRNFPHHLSLPVYLGDALAAYLPQQNISIFQGLAAEHLPLGQNLRIASVIFQWMAKDGMMVVSMPPESI